MEMNEQSVRNLLYRDTQVSENRIPFDLVRLILAFVTLEQGRSVPEQQYPD